VEEGKEKRRMMRIERKRKRKEKDAQGLIH